MRENVVGNPPGFKVLIDFLPVSDIMTEKMGIAV
jgi:hypothetical protein